MPEIILLPDSSDEEKVEKVDTISATPKQVQIKENLCRDDDNNNSDEKKESDGENYQPVQTGKKIIRDDGTEWIEVTKDGHVLKRILKHGEGKQPPVLNRVYVHVVAKLEDGTIVMNYPDEELGFILGHATQPRGLEMAVVGMSVGEEALLEMQPDYGFSKTRRPSNVPEDAKLYMHVTFRRHEKEKNLHQMTNAEKIEFCQQRRAIGKALFEKGEHRSAFHQYDKALTVLQAGLNCLSGQMPGVPPGVRGPQSQVPPETISDDDEKEIRTLLITMLNNVATCKAKVKNWADVIKYCRLAIETDHKNVKAYYNKANAHRMREEYDQAKKDYEKVLLYCSDSKVVEKVKLHLQHVNKAQKKFDRVARKKYKGLFENKEAQDLYQDKIETEPGKTESSKLAPLDVFFSSCLGFFRRCCRKKKDQ